VKIMSSSNVTAVLFTKDRATVATFYSDALGMRVVVSDEYHTRLDCCGFELVVHQIPPHIAAGIVIERPPKRRTAGAIRLDYPVEDIAASRRRARSLGGDIDDAPPSWAGPDADFFFGYDPEGNQFGVTARA
jgi:predicted enzyme related to lactoylglutathione lyase